MNRELTIPRSIYLALGISTVIYILVSFTAAGLAGTPALAASASPLSAAIAATGNSGAVTLVSLGAMVATASVLLTTILGISRIIFAMGRTHDLPPFLSRLHPRYHTPQYAIGITGALMIAMLLLTDLTLVVSVGTFAMLVYYGIANIAAFKIPRPKKRYPPVVACLGGASCVLLMVFLSPVSVAIGIARHPPRIRILHPPCNKRSFTGIVIDPLVWSSLPVIFFLSKPVGIYNIRFVCRMANKLPAGLD